jgi:cellulose biosynthesis protein BcsQ
MSGAPAGGLERRAVHPGPLVDGRPAPNGTKGVLRRRFQRLLTSQGEREEAELERRIRARPGVTRPNTVALISPKGGVGKTTSTLLTGNLLATHLKLRAVAVDANPDFGTLARLAPDAQRSSRSLADLLDDADRLNTAAELSPYVSRLPTGLHLLGAPRDAELTASLGPDRYGELVAFLSMFYEVVLLDLGTGVAGPLARFAIGRADQVVLVTTPEWVTSTVVLEALAYVRGQRDRGPLPRPAPPPRGHDPVRRAARGDARQRHVRARGPGAANAIRDQAPRARGRRPARLAPRACDSAGR